MYVDDSDTVIALLRGSFGSLVQHLKVWRNDVELRDVRRIRRQPGVPDYENHQLIVGDDVIHDGGFFTTERALNRSTAMLYSMVAATDDPALDSTRSSIISNVTTTVDDKR